MPHGRHWLDAALDKLPPLRRLYWRHSAGWKRAWCRALHRAGRLRPSAFVLWIATYRCNYACAFCEASAGASAPHELKTEEALALVDDLAKLRARRLLISGGEPLLRQDLPAVIERAARLRILPGLISNGSLVEARWPELRPFRYFLYVTSIDGPPAFHDGMRQGPEAHAKALRSLELFASLDTPLRVVQTVVHPRNLELLGSMAERLAAAGATDWQLAPVVACGRAAGHLEFQLSGRQLRTLLEFVQDQRGRRGLNVDLAESHSYLNCFAGRIGHRPFFCGAGLTRCAVMPNGDVLACGQAYGSALPEGNIRHTPLSYIWRHGFESFRRPERPGLCCGCEYWSTCQGGCWAQREISGDCLLPVWKES
ncbi:MAG: radical SAM protein [Bryobacteraceae bacterium]